MIAPSFLEKTWPDDECDIQANASGQDEFLSTRKKKKNKRRVAQLNLEKKDVEDEVTLGQDETGDFRQHQTGGIQNTC